MEQTSFTTIQSHTRPIYEGKIQIQIPKPNYFRQHPDNSELILYEESMAAKSLQISQRTMIALILKYVKAVGFSQGVTSIDTCQYPLKLLGILYVQQEAI